jgi:hypothetical protein
MKVLVFDIDGVINSERTMAAFGGYPHDFSEQDLGRFDPVALALVRKLCAATDCVIVLSSTWRLNYTIEEVAHYLDLPIMAATPDLGDSNARTDEIALWLKRHPQIKDYAIVDDLSLDFDEPEHQARFVRTNDEFGLTLGNYRALLRILNPGVSP